MKLTQEQKDKLLEADELIQELLDELPTEGSYMDTWIAKALKEAIQDI